MNRRDLLKFSGTLFAGTILTQGYAATSALASIAESNVLPPVGNTPLYLHYNENSLGLSPKAKQAIIDIIPFANRYPDAYVEELQQTIAKQYAVKPSQISLGVGSSDIIRAIVNKLGMDAATKGHKIQLITPDPSFFLAADHAAGLGIAVVKVPLDESYAMDLTKMKSIADSFDGMSICYLCNPNNPTGALTPSTTIEKWIHTADASKTFFMVDEAYAEYITDANFKSGISFIKEDRNNVIVLRTFSKVYAMAGLRVGYGIATTAFSEALIPYMTILNISITSAVAGVASLNDSAFLAESLSMNKKSMLLTTSVLDELRLKYVPSQGNFIFHRITGDPQTFINRMEDAGIIVGRPFPPLTEWIRITLGTGSEMMQYAKTLKDFRKKGWI